MNMADRHEELVKIRVGTRHPITLKFADGSTRTVAPIVEKRSGTDYYPNLVRVKTVAQDMGTDGGGLEMHSQTMGEVFNLPSVGELAEDEIVFVSGLVVTVLQANDDYQYSGRVVSPGKTKRGEGGLPEAILSWNTISRDE